jgi:hypothetical protein
LLYYSSLPFSPALYYSTALCFIMPSFYTDAMYLNIIHSVILFRLLLLPSPLKQSTVTIDTLSLSLYIYIHVYICIYMIMFVFGYTLLFWVYIPHTRENIQPLSFWTWLILLNMIILSSTHLPANNKMSFFFMAGQYSIVHVYILYIYVNIT